MKTLLSNKPDRWQVGSGPFITGDDRRRAFWTAAAVIVVYAILAAFYLAALG